MKSLYERIRLRFSDMNPKKMSQKSHVRARKNSLYNNYKSNTSSNNTESPLSDIHDISLTGLFLPSNCEKCPASGMWAWKGPGLWCFYSAYFLGKSTTPATCDQVRKYCKLIHGEMTGSKLK